MDRRSIVSSYILETLSFPALICFFALVNGFGFIEERDPYFLAPGIPDEDVRVGFEPWIVEIRLGEDPILESEPHSLKFKDTIMHRSLLSWRTISQMPEIF